jgi:hypothetical protein
MEDKDFAEKQLYKTLYRFHFGSSTESKQSSTSYNLIQTNPKHLFNILNTMQIKLLLISFFSVYAVGLAMPVMSTENSSYTLTRDFEV